VRQDDDTAHHADLTMQIVCGTEYGAQIEKGLAVKAIPGTI
jgi:hypothetical protein